MSTYQKILDDPCQILQHYMAPLKCNLWEDVELHSSLASSSPRRCPPPNRQGERFISRSQIGALLALWHNHDAVPGIVVIG